MIREQVLTPITKEPLNWVLNMDSIQAMTQLGLKQWIVMLIKEKSQLVS